MTCVIGCRYEDGVIMGADSAGTDGSDFQVSRLDNKIFVKENRILFGISGSFRMRDILMYDLKLPKRMQKESVDEYMRTKLVESIRILFAKKGLSKIDDNEQSFDGNILVGIENKLYQIESDFQVGENSSIFNAIGSGHELATGAMAMYMLNATKFDRKCNLTNDLPEIMDSITNALTIASSFKSSVRPPFNFKILEHKPVLANTVSNKKGAK